MDILVLLGSLCPMGMGAFLGNVLLRPAWVTIGTEAPSVRRRICGEAQVRLTPLILRLTMMTRYLDVYPPVPSRMMTSRAVGVLSTALHFVLHPALGFVKFAHKAIPMRMTTTRTRYMWSATVMIPGISLFRWNSAPLSTFLSISPTGSVYILVRRYDTVR